MKWFQHHTQASTDAKLQKVLMKYGFEGYGLYWFCIESICKKAEDLTFELEQDSEILAHIGKMDSRKVEEIMLYMVNLGLFQALDGVISCRKIARYLGENLTRSPKLKAAILEEKKRYKQLKSETVSDNLRLSHGEDRRGEDKRGEERRITNIHTPKNDELFELFYAAYPKKTGKADAKKAFKKLNPTPEFTAMMIEDCRKRVATGHWCAGPNKSFIPGPAPYINQERWTDEIIPRADYKPSAEQRAQQTREKLEQMDREGSWIS